MKTTDKHFKIFKKECERLIKEFGLIGWEVCIVHQETSKNSFADFQPDLVGKVATIRLNTEWDNTIKPLTEQALKVSAKHEVIHLLLARLSVNAQCRFLTSDDLTEAEEELVRILEKLI